MSEAANSLTPRVTFGVRAPNSGPLATPASLVEVAREAEALGYDSVWVHDHLTWSDESTARISRQARITAPPAIQARIFTKR